MKDKDKLITTDLNVMFTRNRDGSIGDLSLGKNSYLDHCHIEQNYVRIGTANNHAAKGYYFNDATPRSLLMRELVAANYSDKIKEKILICFDKKFSTLDLSNCNLTKIPAKEILSKLSPHLGKLYLSNNQISEIKENAFAGLTSLQTLSLSNNKISAIKENAFAGLTSLQTFDLYNNQISEIKENAFAWLTSLQKLDLSTNKISEIKKNAFAGLTSLQTLYLSNNQQMSVQDRWAVVSYVRALQASRMATVNEVPRSISKCD